MTAPTTVATTALRLPGLAALVDGSFDVIVTCGHADCGHTNVARAVPEWIPERGDEISPDWLVECPSCGATTAHAHIDHAGPVAVAEAIDMGWSEVIA